MFFKKVSIQYLILWPAVVCQDLVCYSFNNRCHNLHMIFSACKPCAQMFSYQPSLGVQVTALTFNFIKLFSPKFLLSKSNGRDDLSCGGILWNSLNGKCQFPWCMEVHSYLPEILIPRHFCGRHPALLNNIMNCCLTSCLQLKSRF